MEAKPPHCEVLHFPCTKDTIRFNCDHYEEKLGLLPNHGTHISPPRCGNCKHFVYGTGGL